MECSPSDTPPILLPRHLPPSLSFAANSLRSHMPLCDSMAATGLPADVRRCSEWICFPPPASCFSQTQKPLPSPLFEWRDRVWRSAGDDVRWARDVLARSVLHLQKTHCLEGAGKAALELDAACPSLARFQFYVYSNASCGRQFQTSRRFFDPCKKQRGLRNSRSTPAGTASCPFNQNPPSETPSRPSPRIPHPKPPHTTQPRISNLLSKSSLFY